MTELFTSKELIVCPSDLVLLMIKICLYNKARDYATIGDIIAGKLLHLEYSQMGLASCLFVCCPSLLHLCIEYRNGNGMQPFLHFCDFLCLKAVNACVPTAMNTWRKQGFSGASKFGTIKSCPLMENVSLRYLRVLLGRKMKKGRNK